MTLNKETKHREDLAKNSVDWMFQKARELGFSSEEIGRLKSLYHPDRNSTPGNTGNEG